MGNCSERATWWLRGSRCGTPGVRALIALLRVLLLAGEGAVRCCRTVTARPRRRPTDVTFALRTSVHTLNRCHHACRRIVNGCYVTVVTRIVNSSRTSRRLRCGWGQTISAEAALPGPRAQGSPGWCPYLVRGPPPPWRCTSRELARLLLLSLTGPGLRQAGSCIISDTERPIKQRLAGQ